MDYQVARQTHEVIAARWLKNDIKPVSDVVFDFRNGGVINDGTPSEMKGALKNFAATYCNKGFTGRLIFCLKSKESHFIKITVAPKNTKDFILNMDLVFPHVYDQSGDRVYTAEEDLKEV